MAVVGQSKCPTLLSDSAPCDRKVTKRVIIVRLGLICPRPHCGGNLNFDPDIGGHLYDLHCTLCGRVASHIKAGELRHKHHVDWRTVQNCDNGAKIGWWRIEVDVT